MGIDIWYDFNEEAKESTNVQEYNDSEIIIWNKGDNAKIASQETPQLNSKNQIAKKPPPSVNHVTRSGRVYQPFEKEKDICKGKEMLNNTVLAKEEDDTILKKLKTSQAQTSI